MKRIRLIVLYLFFAFIASLSQARPTIIAVAAFSHQQAYPNHVVLAVREQVVTDLVRRYDCITLARSHGYSLAVEDAINRFADIGDFSSDTTSILAADFSVSGYFQISGTEQTECILLVADLRSERSTPMAKLAFIVPSLEDASRTIVSELVRYISLSERMNLKSSGLTVKPKDLAWMVLPFSDITGHEHDIESAGDNNVPFSIMAELALQERAGIEKLVDHTVIDEIFLEKNIHASSGITELMAAEIARIVGADRILMGAVSHTKDKLHRIDLKIVDAKTGIIINAETLIYDKRNELSELIPENIEGFVNKGNAECPFVEATKWQRRREAEFYLDSAAAASPSVSTSGKIAGLAHAEMAYMMEHDDPVFAYKIAVLLWSRLLRPSMPLSLRKHIVETSSKILNNIEHDANTRSPLLERAQAYNKIDEYSKAMSLADQHKQRHPNIDADKANLTIAEAHIGLKNYDTALSFVKQYSGNDLDDWSCYLKADIYYALGDGEAEFKALDSLPSWQFRVFSTRFPRYMELLRKYKGPQAVIDFVSKKEGRTPWYTSRKDVQYYLALSYLDVGNNKEAGRISKWLLEEESDEKKRKKLEEIIEKSGYTDDEWKIARQVRSFPEKYAIYIQALGDVNSNLLESARMNITEFYGARTRILPPLPLPRNSRAYREKRGQYHAGELRREMSRKVVVPSDAVSVLMVMRENMYVSRLRYCYGSHRRGEGAIVSYHIWQGRKPMGTIAQCLSKTTIKDVAFDLGMHTEKHPCLMSTAGDSGTVMRQKYAFSAEAQEQYKAVDFLAANRYIMDRYRSVGARIVDPSKIDFVNVTPASNVWFYIVGEEPISSGFFANDSEEKGLKAEYFSGTNFKTRVLTRIDKNIDFEWAKEAAEGLSEDNFSVRWTGKLKPVITGTYRLGTQSDDGVRLWLDGEKLIDNWTDHWPTFDASKVVKLEAGKEYGIKLEYYENSGGATIKLYWRREEK